MLDGYLIEFIAALIAATAITRTAVLFFPRSIIDSPLVREFNRFFPAVILTLLIIYSVQGFSWRLSGLLDGSFPYREVVGIAVTAGVHVLMRRNVFLSLASGTGIYILWPLIF